MAARLWAEARRLADLDARLGRRLQEMAPDVGISGVADPDIAARIAVLGRGEGV